MALAPARHWDHIYRDWLARAWFTTQNLTMADVHLDMPAAQPQHSPTFQEQMAAAAAEDARATKQSVNRRLTNSLSTCCFKSLCTRQQHPYPFRPCFVFHATAAGNLPSCL